MVNPISIISDVARSLVSNDSVYEPVSRSRDGQTQTWDVSEASRHRGVNTAQLASAIRNSGASTAIVEGICEEDADALAASLPPGAQVDFLAENGGPVGSATIRLAPEESVTGGTVPGREEESALQGSSQQPVSELTEPDGESVPTTTLVPQATAQGDTADVAANTGGGEINGGTIPGQDPLAILKAAIAKATGTTTL